MNFDSKLTKLIEECIKSEDDTTKQENLYEALHLSRSKDIADQKMALSIVARVFNGAFQIISSFL